MFKFIQKQGTLHEKETKQKTKIFKLVLQNLKIYFALEKRIPEIFKKSHLSDLLNHKNHKNSANTTTTGFLLKLKLVDYSGRTVDPVIFFENSNKPHLCKWPLFNVLLMMAHIVFCFCFILTVCTY